ncbi:hypothetical protein [Kitasatospora kifunensis]|uniref:SH3 domain-containing protein n=1 Tax=Kitasatospora kifunensis TaxID=58351 RepID=A0A7W7RB31_KITKI|nr:hypothetical protein [Kitasatospora kifunensis]MBB4928750.1 hypothetical protein [Kitasatospora kifunensis]
MPRKWFIRVGALALGASAMVLAVPGLANASETLSTSHGVGVYASPDATSTKYITLWAPDEVSILCWVSGGQVYNDGDVWYKINAWSPQNDPNWNYLNGWVFAPYVDGAALFHNDMLSNCNS